MPENFSDPPPRPPPTAAYQRGERPSHEALPASLRQRTTRAERSAPLRPRPLHPGRSPDTGPVRELVDGDLRRPQSRPAKPPDDTGAVSKKGSMRHRSLAVGSQFERIPPLLALLGDPARSDPTTRSPHTGPLTPVSRGRSPGDRSRRGDPPLPIPHSRPRPASGSDEAAHRTSRGSLRRAAGLPVPNCPSGAVEPGRLGRHRAERRPDALLFPHASSAMAFACCRP
jgi:hypothetical protein